MGVKYWRRPAMAEVVSTTKNKITECLMLSGREAGHSTLRLSLTLLIRPEVPAPMLRVPVCSYSAHSLVFTLLCVHPLAVSTLGVVIWTAVTPAPPS